nr:immunoglobulin heavy chain junction region [Mus musculus]
SITVQDQDGYSGL